MSPRWGPPKYEPLRVYLAGLDTDQVTLTFTEIEQIIRAALPSSAWARNWWTNTTSGVWTRAWRAAGWAVVAVDLRTGAERVTFARQPAETTRQPFGSH